MPRIAKILIGILVMIFFVAVVVIVLGVRLVKKSLPQTSGELVAEGLHSVVKVYRDSYGVPHIFAQNEPDLYFAMGYVVSQDRLWQMDLNRRAAMGTLSEIFGSRTLEIDKFMRTIGLPKIANELTKNISSQSKTLLSAYVNGVNAYLEQNQDRLPNEFILMQYRPQLWKIEHSLAYQRLITWSLEMGWLVDPVFGEIIERVGAEKTNEILPNYPANAPLIINSRYSQFNELQNLLNNISHSLFDLIGFTGSGLGSNSWVISGQRTNTGKPLLANDPHLTHQNPSIWYEVHLKSPEIDCYGVSFPGIPGIVIGHNQAIAWGLTNVMADGCDFFIERMNPENQEQYFNQGKWYETTKIMEEIHVRDQKSVNLMTRFTRYGPIISDLHPILKNSSKVISLKWNGYLISDESLAFHKIIKARNWNEFIDGLQYFAVPAQNYVYADTAGNIGYYCCGSIPIRRNGNGLIPREGWNNRYDWREWIPFRRLPHSLNPSDGIIVTANNKVIDDQYPYFITTYWEPPYRAERIKELLIQKTKIDVNQFKDIQSDVFSKHAQFLMPFILEVLPQFKHDTELRTYFYHSLQTWDFNLESESEATTIFEVFLTKLFQNIFLDEMGDSLFYNFLELPNIPIRITDNLLVNGISQWFDNINTPEKQETMLDVLLTSLEQTFEYLVTNFGETVYNWRWGKLHSVTLEHALGKKKLLNNLFNIGPFLLGGSCTSVNNASYALHKSDFRTIAGPSMRQIVDLSNLKNSLIVITTGQSGHPLSKHFKDQTRLWLNSKYHQAITDSVEICNSGFDLLILKPKDTK